MALIESCSGISKSFGSRVSLRKHLARHLRRGAPRPDRTERLRQIDAPENPLRPTRARLRLGLDAPQHPRRLRPAGRRIPRGPDRRRSDRGRHRRRLHLDDLEHAARINQTLGRAGFTDGTRPHRRRSPAAGSGASPSPASSPSQPDLLFLDEPTNHLDLEGILWLERLLASAPFASVVVSHDRYFLDNVVNDMAEIDRVYPEGIFRVEGGYSEFLEKKEEFLLAQSSRQESLANKVRREVEWLRRGPKARTGKSKARIDEAGRLIRELGDLEQRSAKGDDADRLLRHRAPHQAAPLRRRRLEVDGRPRALPRPEFHPHARHAARPARPERHGQDDAASHPERRDRARRRPRRDAPPPLRIVYFDQAREQLDPARDSPRRTRRPRRHRHLPRPPHPRRRLGQALPLRFRPARPARRQPLGRRAGARADRAPHAPAAPTCC